MSALGLGAAIFGCAGPVLQQNERAFFADVDPFGFIIFARNVETPDQLRRLTGDLRAAVGRDAPILIDQEGGRVQRLRGPHWREWMPPLAMVQAAGANAARVMALRYRMIARELRSVGIDANCAPVAYLSTDQTHAFLKNRCYGSDPIEVSSIARAVADAHLAEGVLPVLKHMPGHGRSAVDTHYDLPMVNADRETLQRTDFAPFRALNDLPMAMTAHLVFSAYDMRPATQSSVMVDVIRNDIGFGGLLITDDLNMQALSGTLASRTALAMAAGCDLALHCKGDLAEMIVVAAAAGGMAAATLIRARRASDARHPPNLVDPDPVDIDALQADLLALLPGACDA